MFTLWALSCAFDTLLAPSLKKEMAPLVSPITTSLLGVNKAHKTYFGLAFYKNMKRKLKQIKIMKYQARGGVGGVA